MRSLSLSFSRAPLSLTKQDHNNQLPFSYTSLSLFPAHTHKTNCHRSFFIFKHAPVTFSKPHTPLIHRLMSANHAQINALLHLNERKNKKKKKNCTHTHTHAHTRTQTHAKQSAIASLCIVKYASVTFSITHSSTKKKCVQILKCAQI